MRKGFTLIELIIVVTILALLVTIVAIAIDAPRRFAQTNDVRRQADVRNILNSIHEYVLDHKGSIPPGLTLGEKQLGYSVSGCVNLKRGCNVLQSACLDMSDSLKEYMKNFPKDPKDGSNAKTNYSVTIDDKSIVTVKACGTEGNDDISMSM